MTQFSILHVWMLAIDLGTYNTCSVLWHNGVETLIEDCQGDRLIPSCIEFNEDGSVKTIGKVALKQYWTKKNFVRCAKRIIGMEMNSTDMRDYMKNCHAKVISNEQGYPVFSIPAFPDNSLTPKCVMTYIIQYISSIAMHQFNRPLQSLVLTVPAFFTQLQREELLKAARDARVCKDVHIISEPVAAAYKFGIMDLNQPSKFMVIDFGAGTLDLCIMEHSPTCSNVIGIDGSRSIGGDDITNLLCEYLQRKFSHQYGKSLLGTTPVSPLYRQRLEELKDIAEYIKIALSQLPSIMVNLDLSFNDQDDASSLDDAVDDSFEDMITITISRDELAMLSQPLLEGVRGCIYRCMKSARCTEMDLDHVILVGGSARLLCFQETVQSIFGNKVRVTNDPDECVARGALLALKLSLLNQSHPLYDILHYSYGTIVCNRNTHKDQFEAIIPKGTPFPTNKVFSRIFSQIERSNGNLVDHAEIGVYISSELVPNDYYCLKPFTVCRLSTHPKNQVIVEFFIDSNGILYVEVKQTVDGRVILPRRSMCQAIGLPIFLVS